MVVAIIALAIVATIAVLYWPKPVIQYASVKGDYLFTCFEGDLRIQLYYADFNGTAMKFDSWGPVTQYESSVWLNYTEGSDIEVGWKDLVMRNITVVNDVLYFYTIGDFR